MVDNYETNADTRVRMWCTTLPRVGRGEERSVTDDVGLAVTVVLRFKLRRLSEKFEAQVKVAISSGQVLAPGHIVVYESASLDTYSFIFRV